MDTKMTDITMIPSNYQQLVDNTAPKPTCEYLKDGKLYFAEPKLRAENHVLISQKIVLFRHYRAGLEKSTDPQLNFEIPPEFYDVIAALAQDSEEPLKVLVTRINDTLSPFMRNETIASKFDSAIERATRQLAHKRTYGLKQEVYSTIENTPPHIPWHLNLFRWEVERLDILPADLQQAITMRRNMRIQMTETFSNYISSLSQEEKSTIVNTKHRRQPTAYKETSISDELKSKLSIETEQEREERRLKKEEEKKRKEDERKQREEEKRAKDEEKKRVREEEKKAKEEEKKRREEEKRKKEQSQLRLTSLFAKTTTQDSTPHIEQKKIEQTKPTLFPAFYIKDHVTIHNPAISTNNNDTITSQQQQEAVSVYDFISGLSAESKQTRGISTHVDVRTLLLPGSADILHSPNVRAVLKMKLLQFSEDVRPAYYGTWTKRSHTVKGKTPFAKDTDVLDYDVDSEAEWEPEGEGEDINSDEEDDDPNAEVIDPEDAGWLVPEGYLSDSEGVEDEEGEERNKPSFQHQKSGSKRGVIRKIVLGPFFEGETEEDEVMKPFATQFFVDVNEEGYNPFYKEPTTTKINTATKDAFTTEHKNALINLINDKPKDSIPNLISEAKTNSILKDVSKRQLEARIKDIAVKEKRGTDTRASWYIKEAPPQ